MSAASAPPVGVSATRTVSVAGLVNGTKYTFTVTPYDANGIGTPSSKSPSVTPQKVAPFTTIDRFIEQQFQDFYGRRPTSAELADWRAKLNAVSTPGGMINTLWGSSPHSSVMPPMTRLYSAFYVRIPDYNGLVYWAQQRRSGVSMASIANTFARTPEFRDLYGTVTNAQFVDLVYENVLGRPPSASDRTYWTGELNAGRRTRGTLMIGFSESAEYKNKTAAEINASLIIIEMLRRTPNSAGHAGEHALLVASLKGGTSLTTLFTQVLNSAEYATRAT